MLFRPESFWFAIQVKPRLELNIASVLKSKGYEVFIPTYRFGHISRTQAIRPLFAGYVFCRFDPVIRAPIVTTPGVIRVVGYGKTPSSLSDSEMEAVRVVACSDLPVKPHAYLAPGRRVRIHSGPLNGLEGEIVQTGIRQSLVVSVSLLQRSIAVEVQPAWLEAMPPDTLAKESPFRNKTHECVD